MCIKVIDLYLSAEISPNSSGINYENSNTDVIVTVEEEGEELERKVAKYVASFFTYDNILYLRSMHCRTGEYLHGQYFYSKNMMIINNCSIENIRSVVFHLIEEGGFRDVFREI